ncbi:hypothetical protein PHLGIDRAFT_136444 [Phlebiopsis gigantea 11061_1 CR5-6]|uniref:Uncharacterized protein n=1 Tax=Phlebiopsis gigantea (strain 11061_1 CR5-6) TaxID=745531 RepID=A0A0C3SFX0_PHLG1|nr:hypothetical protein PHLGIDRAFT_136444 [Phlebiopsis gigantea 11061_1 CR5-6]
MRGKDLIRHPESEERRAADLCSTVRQPVVSRGRTPAVSWLHGPQNTRHPRRLPDSPAGLLRSQPHAAHGRSGLSLGVEWCREHGSGRKNPLSPWRLHVFCSSSTARGHHFIGKSICSTIRTEAWTRLMKLPAQDTQDPRAMLRNASRVMNNLRL